MALPVIIILIKWVIRTHPKRHYRKMDLIVSIDESPKENRELSEEDQLKLESVIATLRKSKPVPLIGFGNFVVTKRKSKQEKTDIEINISEPIEIVNEDSIRLQVNKNPTDKDIENLIAVLSEREDINIENRPLTK